LSIGLVQCEECKRQVCWECYEIKNGVGLCKGCRPLVEERFRRRILTNAHGKCPACGSEGCLKVVSLTLFKGHAPDLDPSYRRYTGPIQYEYLLECTNCSFPLDMEHMTLFQEAQEAEHEGRYEEAAQIYKGLDLPEREDAMHLRAAEKAEEEGRYEEAAQIYKGLNLLDLEHMMHLQAAERAERKGDHEVAAHIYERLNKTDMARSMPAGNHAGTVTPANQDLDRLIEQIRREGLVVLYICPKCNGLIKIDGEYDQGNFCENCGTPLSTAIIASMLNGSFSQLKSL